MLQVLQEPRNGLSCCLNRRAFQKSVAPPRIRRQSWANPFEAALSIYIVNLRQLRGHNLFRQIWQFNRQIGGKRNSVSFKQG
ncbi:MAG: hypothetical protein CMQ45_07545 [Gammaproteobacteria bacterium]|nr:hypothetical protein [Gammaproteobacteria bacterium]